MIISQFPRACFAAGTSLKCSSDLMQSGRRVIWYCVCESDERGRFLKTMFAYWIPRRAVGTRDFFCSLQINREEIYTFRACLLQMRMIRFGRRPTQHTYPIWYASDKPTNERTAIYLRYHHRHHRGRKPLTGRQIMCRKFSCTTYVCRVAGIFQPNSILAVLVANTWSILKYWISISFLGPLFISFRGRTHVCIFTLSCLK